MAKRLLDIVAASAGLIVTFPLTGTLALAIWLQDRQNPFYVAPRVARGGRTFKMIKLRSMVANADRIGGSSTSAADRRITPIGRFVRAYKLDEIPQLINVLTGEMSLVGPRPQVVADAEKYTAEERHLLDVRPGVTDFSSIVFADEGQILHGAADPDHEYDRLIRPWKSRLGLFYVRSAGFLTDVWLIGLTAVAIFSRQNALRGVQAQLRRLGAPDDLVQVAGRTEPLAVIAPPGLSLEAKS